MGHLLYYVTVFMLSMRGISYPVSYVSSLSIEIIKLLDLVFGSLEIGSLQRVKTNYCSQQSDYYAYY
ncbi:hypothetical protein OWV82_024754 [Melia azedarach]|uniref:Uncharacterized protein n=1 Tax=Melia azedarach TaxID=155640 RepID=A0ACC1WQT7_MELAZ|nr:hypothetical protein OWV82_024754 [Melia azedarach]